MQSTSTSWRWTVWIALFAVMMNALAPSISHAMAAGGGVGGSWGNWDICRADGSALAAPGQIGLAAAGASEKRIEQGKAAPMADCLYCLPHGGSVALLPSAITGAGLLGGHALRPFLFYRAPQPLLALCAARPRGPPAFV